HERADTAKARLARADDFLQQTCPKYAATAALCSGGYDDPLRGSRPAPGKSRVTTRLTGRTPTAPRARRGGYLSSTLAPAPSSCSLALSASSLDTFSRTGFGAASTRPLASST